MHDMPRPVPFRGGGFRPQRIRGVGVAVFVVLIFLVEWGTRAGWISSLTLPRPSDVGATLVQLWMGWLASNFLDNALFFSKESLLNTIIGIIIAPFLSLKYVSFCIDFHLSGEPYITGTGIRSPF